MSPELRTRIVVGAGLAFVAIGALWLGGIAWWVLAAGIALGALWEWSALVGADRLRQATALAVLAASLLWALPLYWGTDRATVAFLMIGSLLLAMVPRSGALALGTAYIGLAGIALLFLREQPHGFLLALWALAIVWATDIGAYFAGRAIGGPKLAPRISPNKTWAGLIGGMVAAGIVGLVVGALGHLPATTLWAGPPLAILAQMGDLLESWMKRRVGAKDSGQLLPGHGGLLDRIDGLLPVAILVAAAIANGTF